MKPTKHARFIASLILVAGAMLAATPAGAAGGATQLPLSDFLTAQGTSATFQPPSPDEIGWSGRPPDYPHLGWMDYTGLANAWLVAASGGFLNMGTRSAAAFSGAILPEERSNTRWPCTRPTPWPGCFRFRPWTSERTRCC